MYSIVRTHCTLLLGHTVHYPWDTEHYPWDTEHYPQDTFTLSLGHTEYYSLDTLCINLRTHCTLFVGDTVRYP